jgi:hypothetical protein
MVDRIFSYDEAAALLPSVKRLTEEAVREVAAIQGSQPRDELSEEAMAAVARWGEALRSLGVVVKGLWLADFDNGSGYYCWRYPEEHLQYYHTYEDGFRGRMRIH